MVLSPYVYTAEGENSTFILTSADAMADPYGQFVTLAPGFVNVSNVRKNRALFDTHFEERNRFGRLLTFVARLLHEHGPPIYGIGISQHSAFAVNETGQAVLLGNGTGGLGTAYVLYGQAPVDHLPHGLPLNVAPLRVQLLETGDVFDLATMTGGKAHNSYYVGAKHGVLTVVDPYNPTGTWAPSSSGSRPSGSGSASSGSG